MKKIGLIMILLINLVLASNFISATPTEEEVKIWEQEIRDDPTAIKDMSREEIKWVRPHLILQAFEQLLEDNLSIHMFVLEPQRELRITSFRKDIKLMLPHTGLDHLEIVNLPALREVFEGYFRNNFQALQDEKTEVWFWYWYEQNLIVDWGSSDYSFSLTSSTNDWFLRDAETNDPEGYERFMGVVGDLPSDNENLMVYLYGFIVKRIFENDHLKSLDDFTRNEIILTGMSPDYTKPGKLYFPEVNIIEVTASLSLVDYLKKNFPEGEFIPFKDLTYPEKSLLSIYYDNVLLSLKDPNAKTEDFGFDRIHFGVHGVGDETWLNNHLYFLYSDEEQRGETGLIHDPITLGIGWNDEVDIALVNLIELTFGGVSVILSLEEKNDDFTSIDITLDWGPTVNSAWDLEVNKGNQITFFSSESIITEPVITETKELGGSAITGQVTGEQDDEAAKKWLIEQAGIAPVKEIIEAGGETWGFLGIYAARDYNKLSNYNTWRLPTPEELKQNIDTLEKEFGSEYTFLSDKKTRSLNEWQYETYSSRNGKELLYPEDDVLVSLIKKPQGENELFDMDKALLLMISQMFEEDTSESSDERFLSDDLASLFLKLADAQEQSDWSARDSLVQAIKDKGVDPYNRNMAGGRGKKTYSEYWREVGNKYYNMSWPKGLGSITGEVTAETIEPVIVFPGIPFGRAVGTVQVITININNKEYNIKYNPEFVENGFLYSSSLITKFDENGNGILTADELKNGSESTGCPMCAKKAKELLDKYPSGIQALPFSTDAEKATAAKMIACEREGGLLDVNGNNIPCSEQDMSNVACEEHNSKWSCQCDMNEWTAQECDDSGECQRNLCLEESVYDFYCCSNKAKRSKKLIKVIVNDKKITSDKPVVIAASEPTTGNELTSDQRRLFARLANAQEKLTLGDKKAIATRDNLIKELSDTHKVDVYQVAERQTDDNGRTMPWYQHWRQLGRGVDIAKKVEELRKRIEKYEAKKDKERVYVLIDKKHDLHLVNDDKHAQATIEVDDKGYITLDASEIDKDTKISFEKQKRELSSLFIKKHGSFTIKEDGSIPWYQRNAEILADIINMKVLTSSGVYYFEEGGIDHYLSVADELSKIEEIQQKINDKNCEEEWDKGDRTQLSRECDQLSLERDRLYLEAAKKLSKSLYYRGTLIKDEYKALEDKYEELLAEKIRNKKLQALKATILSKAKWLITPENEALSLQNLNIEITYERGQDYTRLAEFQERINELDKKGKDKTITEEEMKEYGLVVIERNKVRKQMRTEGDPWIDRRGNMNADEWYRHIASLAPEAPPEKEPEIPEIPLPEPYIVKVGEGLTLAAVQIPASCRAINCHWAPELLPQKLPEEHPPKGFLVEITNADTGEVTRYVAETGDLPEVPEDGRYAVKITNIDTGKITTMIEAPSRMEKDYSIPITSLIGNYWKIMALSWP
ncbi:MAG: hypothetical protein ISS25_01555 [Nanoarchaeota archaeon]|nr:hypothetical protein [DPANN group archaeon]MBL7116496.1 hypothetical protein [Nanoarchaeota archaeon]